MRHEVRRVINPDHPALAGHFPGYPVVPGVVILSELVQATETWLDWSGSPVSVASIKFMRLLRPSEAFTLRLERLSENRVSFVILRSEDRVASGTLLRAAPMTDQDGS
jgi:3-hydroxyacyl-[acyl-carrier-protein] dehydratase